MSDLPPPLTPPDCDLRGLEYMPLLGTHLFGSEFNARATDTEFRVALTLWWAAWTQKPAASLPDDDVALCRFADLGRDLRTWRKVKKVALHGFVKCNDGRFYHKTPAEQANIAWEKRVNDRKRKAEWRRKKCLGETGEGELALEGNQQLNGKCHADGTRTGRFCDAENALNRRDVTGRDETKPEPSPTLDESIPKPEPIAREPAPTEANTAPLALNYVCNEADWHPRSDTQRSEALSLIDGWLASGFDLNLDILAGIRQARASRPERTRNLKRFTSTIRGKHADRQGASLNGSGDLHREHEARQLVKRTAASIGAGNG